MKKTLNYNTYYYTPKQLVLPLDIQTIIPFDDPIYTFDEIMKGCNLKKYIVTTNKDPRGRIGYNLVTMLEVILFGFMEKGYVSLRELEKMCKTDIRFMYLLRHENKTPTHMTFSNFINKYLKTTIEDIFYDINKYIFEKDNVNLDIVYIDGSKFEANANKYSWVWKNACFTNRDKLFKKISVLLTEINESILSYEMTMYSIKELYEINYLEDIINDFQRRFKIDKSTFVRGKGRRKSVYQKYYEKLEEYINKLKEYAYHIDTCGEKRNSYSKTDKDATFMRVKRDYMGNDQLLPCYNIQLGISDEYISVCDVYQYASDSNCFEALLETFNNRYQKYPTYPVADAGYGNYNNYLYCKEKEMELVQKFAMYKKATEDKNYINDPFRVVNFKRNENGQLVCPNNKVFYYLKTEPIKGNKYGRTEEFYQCEDCSDCPLKSKCHKAKGNRIIKLNEELTALHQEVIDNLNSELGNKLRKNRSIQAEGTIGVIKYDRWYRRIVRRGLKNVRLELFLVSIGYNLYKYHNKKNRIIQ